MRRIAGLVGLTVLVLGGGACDGNQAPRPRPDAGRPEVRTVKPPRDHQGVHVYPPHAIRADGVGPYLLDAPLNDVLHIAPEGPRLEQLELGDLLSWQVVRAEENRLLVGADERSRRVAFIVVLAADVARTDGGMTVGMSGSALLAAFGPAREDRDVVRARKVYEFEKLPNVQFLTNDPPDRPDQETRVVAVLVSRPQPGQTVAPSTPAKPVPAPKPAAGTKPPAGGKLAAGAAAATAREAAKAAPCRSGGELRALPPAELWGAAHLKGGKPVTPPEPPRVTWGCVSGDEPEALLYAGDELTIVGGAPGKLKKVWVLPLGQADQIASLDVDGDGRDEVVATALQRGDDGGLSLQLRAWQWEGQRLVPLASQRIFTVSREDAATAGVRPAGIDLWTEVRPGPGALVVGGLYVERSMAGVRAVAPLSAVRVRFEGRRSPPTVAGPDAGVSEAGPRGGAGPRGHDAGTAVPPAPGAPEPEGGKDNP